MPEPSNQIANLQSSLALCRRMLALVERERAQLAGAAPDWLQEQLADLRREIAATKRDLRALGVLADDQAADDDRPAPAPDLTSDAYLRALVGQLGGVALPAFGALPALGGRLADVYVERTLTRELGASQAPDDSPLLAASGTLPELLSQPGSHLLLVGPPGSGKSACLRALALACASRLLEPSAPFGALLADWGAAPLPLVLPGSALAEALLTPGDGLAALVERQLAEDGLAALAPMVLGALEQGGCLVLIDAADALPRAVSAHEFVGALDQLTVRYPTSRTLICAREFPFAPAGFARYTLAPLEQLQRDELLGRWYALAAGAAGLPEPALPQRRAELLAALSAKPLRTLAQLPLALAICAQVHARGMALPDQAALVLHGLAAWLAGMAGAPGSANAWPQLAALALALHTGQPLGEAAAQGLLAAEPGAHDPAQLLDWWCQHGILLRGPAGYRMPNEPVRGYLAARGLIALPDFLAQLAQLRADARWRAPLLLACELAAREQPALAEAALERLLASAPPDLLLAAEALLAIGRSAPMPAGYAPALAVRLLPMLGAPGLPLAERIRAGMALGRLGDPRFAGELPPLAHVPDGAFLLGTAEGYDDEGPPQWADLAKFAIGVYPVTNGEYARFLAEAGHPAPHFWHDPRLNNPACPVVGVTWHDARAYCAWLTARLRAAGRLPAGQAVRLPTELEWEKAASWDAERSAKRRFPWGDTWRAGCANTADERGDWLTTPAGCFPGGVSAYGLHDCIGNVWEWTASAYASYPGVVEPFHEPGAYSLRGSSCVTNAKHARCTYRSRLPPSYWRHHLGFRIVVGDE